MTSPSTRSQPPPPTDRKGATSLMTDSTTGHDDLPVDELCELQRRAHEARHLHRLAWVDIARDLEEPVAVVKKLVQDYIDRTDAAAAREQMSLFEM